MNKPVRTKRIAAKKVATQKTKKAEQAGPWKSKSALRIERFASEYLIDYNGHQAAIRTGFSPQSARYAASEMLAKPEVQALVSARQAELLAKNAATQEMVLERLTSIATADPRELSELHRGCCRFCWGKDNLYQRTPKEMRDDQAAWTAAKAALKRGKTIAPFDDAGGVGYNPKNDPNPKCPECFGEGQVRVVFKDTRDLSPAARLLYAGVEQTQHGLKVRTHCQKSALVDVGKHLGMFAQKHKFVAGEGDDEEPAQVGFIVLPPKQPEGAG